MTLLDGLGIWVVVRAGLELYHLGLHVFLIYLFAFYFLCFNHLYHMIPTFLYTTADDSMTTPSLTLFFYFSDLVFGMLRSEL